MRPRDQRERVAAARVARLGTLDPAGRVHLVPICFALDGETVYSAVDEKPKRTPLLQRLENVRAHPHATVLIDAYDEDWSQLWWVRLRGPARVLADGPERAQALVLLAEKYAQYHERPPTGPVLAVDVAEWRGWSARGR